jgi:predicted MFS family arabinose efflux permease
MMAIMSPILFLAAAGFTIMTTEFLIVGVLPLMASDLEVTVSQAGLLVSLFAFTVASTGPMLTALLANVGRKRLFVGVLLLFGFSNVLAALAFHINVMVLARFLPALALPVFWSFASTSAIEWAGPGKAGKAMSLIAAGAVAATVLGIPVGALLAQAWGWRSAFGVLGLIAFSKALLLWRFFPADRIKPARVRLSEQFVILRSGLLLAHVALSLLIFTGIFTAYTYLADTLERLAGFDGAKVGWTLMAFGVAGLGGNWLAGRLVDRSPLGATLFFWRCLR